MMLLVSMPSSSLSLVPHRSVPTHHICVKDWSTEPTTRHCCDTRLDANGHHTQCIHDYPWCNESTIIKVCIEQSYNCDMTCDEYFDCDNDPCDQVDHHKWVPASSSPPAALQASPSPPAALQASPSSPAALPAPPTPPTALPASPAAPATLPASPSSPAAFWHFRLRNIPAQHPVSHCPTEINYTRLVSTMDATLHFHQYMHAKILQIERDILIGFLCVGVFLLCALIAVTTVFILKVRNAKESRLPKVMTPCQTQTHVELIPSSFHV